jgi:phosphatidylserine decarboxylase
VESLLLEVCCWDKDRFGKDYMGEFDVVLEDVFQNGTTKQGPKWYPLESKRSGKKQSVVTGEVLLQFTLIDTSNPSASPEQILAKFATFTATTGTPDEEEDEDMLRMDSAEADKTEDEEEEASDEVQDESKKAEVKEKRRRRLRLAKLKRKVKQRAYEFSEHTEVAGVLFLEIVKITDLPPEKNSKYQLQSVRFWISLIHMCSDPHFVRHGSVCCHVPRKENLSNKGRQPQSQPSL